MTEYDIHPLVASRTDLTALIAKLTRFDDVSAAEEDSDDELELTVTDVRDDADDAPVVKLVHSVIAEAIEIGASDIHLEPENTELRVYYRIDGVLTSSTTIPRNIARGVISRIKIMANLDIAEKRLPQDGRLALGLQGRMVDVRVATLPLVTGESVVMRVLDHGGGIIDLGSLGIHSEDNERLRHTLAQPYGLVLVTGPTGSGKTTTLYGSLELLNTGDRSIITIEDPVEYKMAGIKQIQVHSRIGLGFATGLRSMVRADPDVMMVGEIRDRETAQIAVEAALTGHLVLSTMHTRDAATAAPRLVDMGIEPFLVASAVDCVVAQRLARKLCVECKKPVVIPAEALRNAGLSGDGDLQAFEAAGCGRCGETGYRGRIGLYEVLTVTDEIRSLIVRGSSGEALREVALRQGMRTLRMDGFDKVRQGVTSLAETARVAGS
jgi:type IV pilus assembly protein PilB